jgi:hypothetical protein
VRGLRERVVDAPNDRLTVSNFPLVELHAHVIYDQEERRFTRRALVDTAVADEH